MSSLPAFARRRRLRDRTMLAATIVAYLREEQLDSASCDQISAAVSVGRGVVIAACDELARAGYVTKDRGVVALTPMARKGIDDPGPVAA